MDIIESRDSDRPSKRTPQHDSAADETFQLGLKNIPIDLINTIFLMLDLRSTYALCITCKQFQQFITSNNEIWKSLYNSKQYLTNDFKPPQFSWREWFQRSIDARLYLWGSNKAGQLGRISSNSNVPIIAPELANSRVKYIAVSGTQTTVVTDDNNIYHYGIKSSGNEKPNTPYQFPLLKGKYIHGVASGERHTVFLVSDSFNSDKYIIHWGRVLPDDTDHSWTTLPNCPKNVVQVHCGRDFTALLDEEGRVWSYGSNALGQLGTGLHTHWDGNPTKVNVPEPVLLVALGREHMIMATATGLYGCGSNSESQLGIETETDNATSYLSPVLVSTRRYKQITCGYLHSGGITEEHEVFVWGDNSYGALGLGNVPRYFPTPQHVKALDSKKVVKIVGGGYHTHCLTANGEVWSAGYNGAGQCAANDFSISPVFAKANMLHGFMAIDLFASGFHTAGLFASII